MTDHEAMAEFIQETRYPSKTGNSPSCQRHINRPSINLVFRGIMCPNSSSTDSSVSPSSSEMDKSFQMENRVSMCTASDNSSQFGQSIFQILRSTLLLTTTIKSA